MPVLKRNDNFIPVQYIPRVGPREFALLNDGTAVLYADPVYTYNPDRLRNTLFRDIDNFLSPLRPDEYIRVTHYQEDYKHLQDGTHRGSINHAKNETEGGLSVAKYPEFPGRYAYYVTGQEIGQGADGEPLLDLATAKPTGRLMRYETLITNFNRRKLERIEELGLSDEDVRLLHSMAKLTG